MTMSRPCCSTFSSSTSPRMASTSTTVSATSALSISMRPPPSPKRSFGGFLVSNSYLTSTSFCAASSWTAGSGAGRACRRAGHRSPIRGDVPTVRVRTSCLLLPSALAVAGQAAADAAAGRDRGAQTAGQCLDDPGVHGHALFRSRALHRRLQRVGETQRDAGGEAVLGGWRRGRLFVLDIDERGLLAGETDLDVARGKLRADLEGCLGQELEQADAERWSER